MPRLRRGKTRQGRRVNLTDRTQELLQIQLAAFRAKFGRDPRGDEPVFFDPEADEPRQIDDGQLHKVILGGLVTSGAPPQIIYAYVRTGLLVTESNKDVIRDEDMADWNMAIDEFFRLEDEASGSTQ